MELAGRRILLGVSGSIAAYKAADLCSQLGKLGAEVHVVLTENAAQFVGAATFRALTRNPVLSGVFEEPHEKRIAHIDLAQSADLILVAPASANVLAKMAHGLADDLLTTCLLAAPPETPLLIAPAMNTRMWEHPATLANLEILKSRNVEMVQPGYGLLACQDVGAGKLADVSEIVQAVCDRLRESQETQEWAGKRILITAGATREPLDPVRFLSNRSSGKMGYALALEAANRGATVTLISGFATAALPADTKMKIEVVQTGTAAQMLAACEARFAACDVFIAAAAVADYAPEIVAAQKMKKTPETADGLTLRLKRTPDILAILAVRKSSHQTVVGFAAETEDLLRNARVKLETKNLDLIVANDVTAEGAGFEVDTNIITLLWPDGGADSLPQMSKREAAARILEGLKVRR